MTRRPALASAAALASALAAALTAALATALDLTSVAPETALKKLEVRVGGQAVSVAATGWKRRASVTCCGESRRASCCPRPMRSTANSG